MEEASPALSRVCGLQDVSWEDMGSPMTALRAIASAPIGKGVAASESPSSKTSGTHVDMLAYHQLSSIKHESRAKKEATRADEATLVRRELLFACGGCAERVQVAMNACCPGFSTRVDCYRWGSGPVC